jgi:aspartate aminotransferase-like enzyme
MLAMGLKLFAKSSYSNAATAVCPPEGMDSRVIIKAMRERFGIILANGQGSMEGKLFRLAHLGYYDYPELAGALAALELVLTANGHKVELGAGLRAAQQVIANSK